MNAALSDLIHDMCISVNEPFALGSDAVIELVIKSEIEIGREYTPEDIYKEWHDGINRYVDSEIDNLAETPDVDLYLPAGETADQRRASQLARYEAMRPQVKRAAELKKIFGHL